MPKKLIFILSCFFINTITTYLLAQPGNIDASFGTNGKVLTDIDATHNVTNCVLVQPDGKIIVIGYSTPAALSVYFSLVRYNDNGTLDNSFGTNGIVNTQFGIDEDQANSGILQPDGKILVAGFSWNGVNYDFAIMRYLSNGALDNSFGANGVVTTDFNNSHEKGNQVILQPDGKIIVAGFSFENTAIIDINFALVRYNVNGTLDNSFGTNGKVTLGIGFDGASQSVRSLALQADGKIVIAGVTDILDDLQNLKSLFALARFNTNGSLDNGFGTNGIVTTAINSINDVAASVTIQPDGKIVAVGQTKKGNGEYSDLALVRYNTNGSLDNGFGVNGIVTTSFYTTGTMDAYGTSVTLQPDGKILALGYSAKTNGLDVDFALARYHTNGELDNTFGTSGKVTTDFGSNLEFGGCVALQPDGKIIAAGFSKNGANYDFALARYLSDDLIINTPDDCSGNSISIYPNPIVQNTTLQYTLCNDEIVSVYLIDAKGRKLKEIITNKKQNKGNHLQNVKLEDLPSGTYFVVIAAGSKQLVSKKVIKQ